jgi:hypothetical protein
MSNKISFGQESDFLKDLEQKQQKNVGKDFHERQALTLDELMLKNNGVRANSMRKKRNYIVYEFLVTAKRKPYYEGQIFRFKYSDGERYDLELEYIDDSTFITSYFDNVVNVFENKTFAIKDVKKVYFRPPFRLNPLTFARGVLTPLVYIAASYLYPKYQDPKEQTQKIVLAYGSTFIGKQLFKAATKSRRMKNNRRVRILKSY